MKRLLLLPLVIGVASLAVCDSLDDAIRLEMKANHVPGLSLAVVKNGRIVRLSVYGSENLETSTPVKVETRFEIASISKMFVGAAIRQLVEQGKLDLEWPLTKYFPDAPSGWQGMTLRHLLTMSSGLSEDFGFKSIPYNAEVTSPADWKSMLTSIYGQADKPEFGKRFEYSGPNYALLGKIVEVVSGRSYASYVAENLFKVAEMNDSGLIENSAIVPNRAEGYRLQNGELRRGWLLGQLLHSRPDVGILTTARDLANWIIALESRKVVKEPESLWAGSVSDAGIPLDYAYGWNSDTFLGRRRVQHSGNFRTGFSSYVCRFPNDGVSVIVLCNRSDVPASRFAYLATRRYLPKLASDPLSPNLNDADPQSTKKLVDAMKSLVKGVADPKLFAPQALEPVGIDEASGFAKGASSYTFAGRGTVKDPDLTMHGHKLQDYTTLRIQIGGDDVYLTIYRDSKGRIAYIEQTL